jgi:hypothetical protein
MAGQIGRLGNVAVRIEKSDGTVFYAVRIFGPDGRIAPGEFQSETRRTWTVNLPRTLAQTGGGLPTSDEAVLLFVATRNDSRPLTGLYGAPGIGTNIEGEVAYRRHLENFNGDPNTEFGQEEKLIWINDGFTPGDYYGLYGGNNGAGRPVQSSSRPHNLSYTDYSHTGIIAIFEESQLPPGISVVEPRQQYSDMSAGEQGTVNNADRGTPADLPPDSGDFTTGEGAGPGGASPSIIDESEYYIINQRDREMLDFIASKESNGRYTAVYPGGNSNPQITRFSINQLLQFQLNMIEGFGAPSADTEADDAARSRPEADPDASDPRGPEQIPGIDNDVTETPTLDPDASDPRGPEQIPGREFYSRTGAVGRYQFVSSQIIEAADFLELDRDLVRFSESVQDAMCMEILKQKCDYEDWLRGTLRLEDFQFKLSGQFESIPLPCGGSSTDSDSEVGPDANDPRGPEQIPGIDNDVTETPTEGSDEGTTDESEDPQLPESIEV